jgi:4-phospho-D-threonate 3-dehydrogenase / 4-phospho-D-erythronate 3-dehydrogenase
MKKSRPILAITLGDPAGIGPEIAVKACASNEKPGDCEIIIIGDIGVVELAARKISSPLRVRCLKDFDRIEQACVNVLDMNSITPDDFTMGKNQPACGLASYGYIIKGIELAMQGTVDAIVTNPISKEALKMAGIHYPGHTEILADKTGTKDFSMMFACDDVCVAHVTTHVSLRQALTMISRERVFSHAKLLNGALRSLGLKAPRIAVSGLNPHAGENGLFGDEEIVHIAPAIADAKNEGILASGPYPPDTVFMRAFRGEFDGVVSMLHDHGFVALKSRDFEAGVNITIGLPIIRTSVGHGTAFDIAGKGIASEKSLLAALKAAYKMVTSRKQAKPGEE